MYGNYILLTCSYSKQLQYTPLSNKNGFPFLTLVLLSPDLSFL